MASFSVICNNGFWFRRGNSVASADRIQCLRRSHSVCFSRANNLMFDVIDSGGFTQMRKNRLGFCICGESRHGLSSNTEFRRLVSGNGGNKETHLGKSEKDKILRRRFSLRLRPRLRLLSMRIKKFRVRATLDDIRVFLRKNMKRVVLFSGMALVMGLCCLFLKLTAVSSPTSVPYSDFIGSLQSGSVSRVLIEEGSRRIYYNTGNKFVENDPSLDEKSSVTGDSIENSADIDVVAKENVQEGTDQLSKAGMLKRFSKTRAPVPVWQYSTRKIDHDEKFLLSLMRDKGTTYSSAPQSALMSMRNTLITIISLWIPLTPMMWLLYRQLSAANSPAKKQRSIDSTVGFEDVEGVDAAKAELTEIVSCLQGGLNYQKLGAKLPRGVLLVGPPGTGKTLLARAVAFEAGVPFFSVSASEFVEMFVGRGAARIRDLFSAARKNAPSIIFIDELDAVGGKRGKSFNDERDQTLNQLLTEMDGFESDTKVVVLAATNRAEALDPALCRPGRFSRKVIVGEPDQAGRRKILAVHLRGVPLEEDIALICDLVASLTPGFVGADLANIVNEAALLAARRGGETVTREDIMEAIERAKFGINDKQARPGSIGKELSKLFPWMPSLAGRNDPGQDQGPLGYQALS